MHVQLVERAEIRRSRPITCSMTLASVTPMREASFDWVQPGLFDETEMFKKELKEGWRRKHL